MEKIQLLCLKQRMKQSRLSGLYGWEMGTFNLYSRLSKSISMNATIYACGG